MKINRVAKAKMKRQRDMRIEKYLKCPSMIECIADNSIRKTLELSFFVASLKANGVYYCLYRTDKHAFIVKLVYSSYVKAFRLSNQKVLENKSLFKNWLDILNEKESSSYQYHLNSNGNINVKSTYN